MQQKLPALQLLLSPVWVVAFLFALGVTFIPVGAWILSESNDVVEVSKRYDDIAECKTTISDNSAILPKVCHVSFTLTEDMKPPIYFYYKLEKFYQNHRLYLMSLNSEQLRGEGNDKTSNCDPFDTRSDLTIVPCGMIANSYFSDRFSMSVTPNGGVKKELCNSATKCKLEGVGSTAWQTRWSEWHDEPNWSKSDIAWQSDLDSKFDTKAIDNMTETRQTQLQVRNGLLLPRPNDPDFVVWMRTAALPWFRKLHRVINDQPLNAGDLINVTIANWFSVHEFSGEKHFLLTTTNSIGGKNDALAYCYLTVGSVCVALALAFMIMHMTKPRKMGDMTLFEWANAIDYDRQPTV